MALNTANSTNELRVFLEEVSASATQTTLAEARQLLLEYGRFVVSQDGMARFCFGSLEKEAEHLPLSFIEQGGGCLVARVGGASAGFIAWRALAGNREAWELKRLWVRPVARGIGLGRVLIQDVIDRAIANGRKSIYLDTAPGSMGAAVRLYRQLGFQPCAPYNDNPVEGLAYFCKPL